MNRFAAIRLCSMLSLMAFSGACLAGGNIEQGMAKAGKGIGGQPPCVTCHLSGGAKALAPDQPILAGQYYDYLVRALTDYKSGKRGNPIMGGIAKPLSLRDIEDLSAYFASQKSTLHFQR